ncbi:putative regulatory protein, FmdB family [Burkholderiales bacterium]|nr:putative regulatory protein, FmdB family [Burkholderiales bacterium]
MPIYAYKCSSCQHELDVLQKISEAPLTVCPQCGAATFSKQLTAAGFQLKGSGWYATDFKNGTPADAKTAAKPAEPKPGESVSAPAQESAPAKEPAPAKDSAAAKGSAAAAACGAGGGSACS